MHLEKLNFHNFLVQARYIYIGRKYDCSSVLHPIHTPYRFLITRRRALHQHGKEVRKRGSLGVVSWVSLLARFALLLISDQDDVSRCQQVRLIVSRLFLTRKSARNDPRVIRHIGFPSTRLLSLFPSLFSRDEVIDIFHEKNRGCMQRISYLRLGCIKG